jgi:inner membrane protein
LKPLLLLSYIGALSHILLDLLNTYGIRLLMPFSERWFYGDVLFIVDPWIWLGLGLGVWFSRRRTSGGKENIRRPALGALLGTALYIGAMFVGGRVAEHIAAREFKASGFGAPEQVLASPVFADPFRREIFVQTADGYRFGDFRWTPLPRLNFEPSVVPTNMSDPAIDRAAAQNKRFADFLYWSRYPFAMIEKSGCGTRVTINDGRYSRRPDSGPFGASVLLVEAGTDEGTTRTAKCSDPPSATSGGGEGGAR